MTDGELAIIGLGSVGSMALWQAAKLSGGGDVAGFEARTPAHGRSAVGGDSRLFRMTFQEQYDLTPLLESSLRLWRELETDSGQEILTQCGGLSIDDRNGGYFPAILRKARETGAPHTVLDAAALRARYPQHRVGDDDVAVFDPRSGFLRTDRAVLAAIAAAEDAGAKVLTSTPIDELVEDSTGVRVVSGSSSWTFERVVLAAGGWSRHLLPAAFADAVEPRRIFLTWFVAREPESFTPERFPIFCRVKDGVSVYGTPSLDGATVKATLDGRGLPASSADNLTRTLTDAEVAETELTIPAFLPGLAPSIVRSDCFPDLYTPDRRPLVGSVPGRPRTFLATGFSGKGFKIASGVGSLIARQALGDPIHPDLQDTLRFADPGRFASTQVGLRLPIST